MSTTLNIESFNEVNLRERTRLDAIAAAGATVIQVESAQGYAAGDIIYVGQLSREGCEKAVVASIVNQTTINLSAALALPHTRFEPVTSVLGDKIHIYRAVNIDGTVPAEIAFSVLATRQIDPDQLSTYYTDSTGNSSYWYRNTYYNETSLDETDLGDSIPVRGDDFGHYASLTEIRTEAGFSNNYNIKDAYLDQKRRAAEAEINTSLASSYTTPFIPVPDVISTLTIALTVGMIWADQYGENSSKAKGKLADVRASIKGFQDSTSGITDADGISLSSGGISSWPDDTAPRAFFIGDRF